MTIDPKTLPGDARVEATADHFPDGFTHFTTPNDVRIRGDLSIVRVFVPVPDGVAYDDALRAVSDARPWVEWDSEKFGGFPEGTRLRVEFRAGVTDSSEHYVHPDDVPDPDADLIELMARRIRDEADRRDNSLPFVKLNEAAQDRYRDAARAALAVIREDGAR